MVVVKQGAGGPWVTDGAQAWRSDAHPVVVVDPVGAGDAFDGGYLSAGLHGHDTATAVRWGCAAGALAVQGRGDVAALPYPDDPEAALAGADIDR